jgi:hypothetical protein
MKTSTHVVLLFTILFLLFSCHRQETEAGASQGRNTQQYEAAKQLSESHVNKFLQSPEYKKAFDEKLALMKAEGDVAEIAPWFGKTGLGEETERELPRYLRREFGESIFTPGALKASDLIYLGETPDGTGTVHSWRIEHGKDSAYAYVELNEKREVKALSWESKRPAAGSKS